MAIEIKSIISIFNKSPEKLLINIDAGVFYYEEIASKDTLKITVKGKEDVYEDFCEIHYFEKQVTIYMDFNLFLTERYLITVEVNNVVLFDFTSL